MSEKKFNMKSAQDEAIKRFGAENVTFGDDVDEPSEPDAKEVQKAFDGDDAQKKQQKKGE
jgi:hypothetical protein